MNWQIDEEKLDDYQKKIYYLSLDSSAIVRGVAGTGKTNLALWRAKYIQATEGNNNFKVLIYTKALRKFIESGLQAIGLDSERVVNFHQWLRNPYEVDHIIVDEAQDFDKDQIDLLMKMKKKSIVFFGDNAQQLYADKNALTLDEIAARTGLQIYDLPFNYRLPLPVAKFAQFLNIRSNDIVNECKNSTVHTLPRLIHFKTWQEELDFIKREIESRNLYGSNSDSTGIFLPFSIRKKVGTAPQHYCVENAFEYFKSKDFPTLHKMNDDIDLDFGSTLPKIMPYNSSKGLQFDTVFVPHCGENWATYKNPMYVALTRTSNRLIITHSDKLSNFIKAIPTTTGLFENN